MPMKVEKYQRCVLNGRKNWGRSLMNLLHVCVIYSVEECSVIYCSSFVFSQQLLTRMNIPNWSVSNSKSDTIWNLHCIQVIHTWVRYTCTVLICQYWSCTSTCLQCMYQQLFPAGCWILSKHGSTDYSCHDKVNYFTPQVPVLLERFLLGSL